METERLVLEAELVAGDALTGAEWEVDIVGAEKPSDLLVIRGKEYLRSKNGRLYSVEAIEKSAGMWEGIKVFDNHLTNDEFIARMGMRSPKNEWLGSLVSPRFVRENGLPKLRAIFKVVETSLREKLKNAHDLGVLNTIGLSMDTLPVWGSVMVDGQSMKAAEGFRKIMSVDLVGNPAAGGGFVRLIAATTIEDETMENDEKVQALEAELTAIKEQLAALVQAQEAAAVDGMSDDEVKQANAERETAKAELRLRQIEAEAQKARLETDLARTELVLERKLDASKLPEKFADVVRKQFAGRVVEAKEIDAAIESAREAYRSMDPTGRVKAGGADIIQVGLNDDERFGLEYMRKVMGDNEFRALEMAEDETVVERLAGVPAYGAWLKAGKPALPRYNKLSSLISDYYGGDPLLDERASEAATTASLATVVKNTVNIMAANVYSQQDRWYEKITRTMEVDTIDDATLARIYGADNLDTVAEGAAYTELDLADEEETASFVKRGNYVGITIETLLRDKINFVQRIPEVLANSWYNTLSTLVANVFLVNTDTGPVLGTSGALFNSTALSSAGGHANLGTSALTHATYAAGRLAMMKQTDQPLGAGRKLLIQPRYLVVPVDLEQTALEIRNSELYPHADGDAAIGTSGLQTINQFRGSFEVVVMPEFVEVDHWALVADPMRYPAIWLVYPRGQRAPQIFSADSELGGSMFTNDTLRFKVRQLTYRFSATYDCAPVSDFRPLYKANV